MNEELYIANWRNKRIAQYVPYLNVMLSVLMAKYSIGNYLFPYCIIQINSWSGVVLEKSSVAELLENFPTFYGT
jgi:hypothetical protein